LQGDAQSNPTASVGLALLSETAKNMAVLDGASSQSAMSALPVDDKVQMMTIHKAKGLEFSVVFLLGLSEYGVASNQGDALDSYIASRNLVYVAVTRAKDALVVSSHTDLSRFANGMLKKELTGLQPSVFLAAMYHEFGVVDVQDGRTHDGGQTLLCRYPEDPVRGLLFFALHKQSCCRPDDASTLAIFPAGLTAFRAL
jgi:hypothetical protein